MYERIGKFFIALSAAEMIAYFYSTQYREFITARKFVTDAFWQQVRDPSKRTDHKGMLESALLKAKETKGSAKKDSLGDLLDEVLAQARSKGATTT